MPEDKRSSWDRELDSLARSVSGSFMFGIAMLYTMELWWVGIYVDFWKKMLLLLFVLIISIFVGYYAGFSKEKSFKWNFLRVINSFAIGIVASTVSLFVINQISFSYPINVFINKVVIMIVPFTIGAFLADVIIPALAYRSQQAGGKKTKNEWKDTFQDISSTIVGGIFIALPIVPSQEVQVLAIKMTYWHLIALVILSLLVSYVIVFTGIPGAEEHSVSLFLQIPWIETILSYSVSIILAFLLLFFFGQITFDNPLNFIISEIIVLSFPMTIGGAAGRLAV